MFVVEVVVVVYTYYWYAYISVVMVYGRRVSYSWLLAIISYLMSPYPTVVMVTTAHQNASGMDLKNDWSEPASAKYTVLENSTTPGKQHAQRQMVGGPPIFFNTTIVK